MDISKHEPLIKKLAAYYKTNDVPAEVLAAAGRTAVIQHLSSYDEEKSTIETWISILCRTAFINAFRSQKVVKYANEVVMVEDQNVLEYILGYIDADTELLQNEKTEAIHKIKTLLPEEKLLLEMRFGLGNCGEMSDEGVAEELGIQTREYRNILESIFFKLRNNNFVKSLYYKI